ncbi:MAG: ZapG family protein, partial [Ectothiorhodospira sp.]
MVGGNILTIAGFIGAGLLGFWFGRQQGDAGRVLELESEVENQRRKLESYRSQVNRHFEKTATLFTGMAHSYRELYEHLVDSYDRLGNGPSSRFLPRRASALLELSREEQRRAIPGKARPAQAEQAPATDPRGPTAFKPEAKPQQATGQQKPAAAAQATDPRGPTAFKPEASPQQATATKPAAARPQQATTATKKPAATGQKRDPRGATAFKPATQAQKLTTQARTSAPGQKPTQRPAPQRPAAAAPAARPASPRGATALKPARANGGRTMPGAQTV